MQQAVPPENLYSDVVLEEGSVVDADYKGRCLTGVVIKKMEDGSMVDTDYKGEWLTGVVIKKMEDERYLVYFDVLPNIIEFERKHLRAHLHWTGSEWVRGEVKELSKSMFSPGTLVEVRFGIGNGEVSWVPAMIVKEIEESGLKKLIMKFCNKSFRFNDSAKTKKTAELRRVRPAPPPLTVEGYKLLDCVEMFHGSGWCQGIVTKVLAKKRYMVILKAKKESLEVNHMDLRPFRVWEDGVWYNRSVLPKSENSKDGNRKRKREEAGTCNSSNAMICDKGKSICNDDDVDDHLSFEKTPAKGTAETSSPFAKTSPFWKTLETNELYNKVPQTPHFNPLFDVNEDLREMSAIGMMVTFYGLLEEVKSVQLDVSSSKLNSLISSLANLEKQGFNVANLQSRLSKMLTLQAEIANKADKRKLLEEKMEVNKMIKQKAEEEIAELERKIMVAREKKEAVDKRIAEKESFVETIDQEIEDLELEFQILAAW